MKRVKIALLGMVVAAGVIVSQGASIYEGRISLGSSAEAKECASESNNCETSSPTPEADPLANPDKSVCVAVPVFANRDQGKCPKGQAEIVNDPGTGGAIVYYAKLVLELLNIAIGTIIMLVLVYAGIQYISSAADPAQAKSAKEHIQQAITALVLYLLMFAILSFLVPGGIFV